MKWWGEEDIISVLHKNTILKYSDAANLEYNDWSTGEGEARKTNEAIYKATRSESQGCFTGVNNEHVLDFAVDGVTPPSVRIIYPTPDRADEGSPIPVAHIKGEEVDKLMYSLPGISTQLQSDNVGSDMLETNFMLAYDPTRLDAYDEEVNPNGIKYPEGHMALGQVIPMQLERQLATVYTKLKNYDSDLLGTLIRVKLTVNAPEGSDNPIISYFNNQYEMDIMYKNSDDKYEFRELNKFNENNTVTLNLVEDRS